MKKNYTIREFDINSDHDAMMWKQLNLQWLQGYSHHSGNIPYLLEEEDFITLDNPIEKIIHKGGKIWFAEIMTMDNKKIVGTIGVMLSAGEWEVTKLAVLPEFQGNGIGSRLIQTVIDFSKKMGIKRLVLDSNHHLIKAIHLYERFGFQYIQPRGHYATADIAMEKLINIEELVA